MADIRKRGLASASESTRRRVASSGGQASQRSGRAHSLTFDERSRGGKKSPGNFKFRPREEVEAAGRKGGSTRRPDQVSTQVFQTMT